MTLTISTRTLGRRRPLLDDFAVPPPSLDRGDGDELRLRDVIEHVVRAQVEAFHRRQDALRFDRVLTARQIENAAARGKVDPAAKTNPQRADPDEAVGAALLAFEDGMYLVVIDGVEHRNLDAPVRLQASSRLVFLRLAFLAGA
jgi:hypothetical protein